MASSYLNSNVNIDIHTQAKPLKVGYAYRIVNHFYWQISKCLRPEALVDLHTGEMSDPVLVCVYVEPSNSLHGVAVASGLCRFEGRYSGSSRPYVYPKRDGSGLFEPQVYGFAHSGYIVDLSHALTATMPSFENTYRGSFALSVLDDAEYDPITGEITKNPTAKVDGGGAYLSNSSTDLIRIEPMTFPIEECTVVAIFNTISRTGNLSLVTGTDHINKSGPGYEFIDLGSFAYNATYKKWYAVQHHTGGSLNFWWRY